MALVHLTALIDPKEKLLIGEERLRKILDQTQIRTGSSGIPVSDEQSDELEVALSDGEIVDLSGSGDWTPTELRVVSDDYFAMLKEKLTGEDYSKMRYRTTLQQSVNRPNDAIERKYQNISAILQHLGFHWFDDYKPRSNYQAALVAAVEANLDRDTRVLERTEPRTGGVSPPIDLNGLFVDPPTSAPEQAKPSIERVVRKFDPAMRDARNRELGDDGELFVIEVEKLKLADHTELVRNVRWASKEDGDGLGYDIESFDEAGNEIFIEVKTTRGPINTPFFLTENERRVASEKSTVYRLYRVFNFSTEPRVFIVEGPFDEALLLDPIAYKATVANTG